MSRFSKALTIMAAASVMAACTPNAKINGTIESAPSSEVIVKLLDVNRYEVLDTVATDASGKFAYKVDIQKGQPEFVYIFRNDVKLASLLLEAGDKVTVNADTLGNYTVEGSEESQKLAQVERDYATALGRLNMIAARMENASADEQAELTRAIGKEYVDYYRSCVKYILQNSTSMTAVPVLYQNFGQDLPVFGQTTDAIHFMNVSDSLELIYPESKYVKALRKEAEKRFGYLELESALMNAQEIGYPDIELPDIQAQKVKLSEVDAKVVMIYFWTAENAGQKMFNLDVLKSLYDDYSKKGFEIYQVSLDQDKTAWAQVVKQQNLPWINVCDSRAAASPYILTYNIGALPTVYIIADGELVDGQIVDEKSLRKLLDKLTR